MSMKKQDDKEAFYRMADTSGLDLDKNVVVIQLFLSCLKLELSRLVRGGKSFNLVRHDDGVKMKEKNYPRTHKLFLSICQTCIYCHDLSHGFLSCMNHDVFGVSDLLDLLNS
jgi:hypothetical protein